MIMNSGWREPIDEACVSLFELPAQTENCIGTMDVQYRYVNPPASWRMAQDFQPTVLNNPRTRQSYVPQQSENGCYAAALQSAFKQLGVDYPQSRFQDAIGHECFGTGNRPLSLSQIIFATTKTHLRSGGVWYVDTPDQFATKTLNNLPSRRQSGKMPSANGRVVLAQSLMVCQAARTGNRISMWNNFTFDLDAWIARKLGVSSDWWARQAVSAASANALAWGQPGNGSMMYTVAPIIPTDPDDFVGKPHSVRYLERRDAYAAVTWSKDGRDTSPSGGIAPIQDTDDMLRHFAKGVPVLAGLTSSISGHVVTVASVATSTAIDPEKKVQRVRVEWVDVLDPASPDQPLYRMDGDAFVRSARFLFAVYDPK